jgi:hypothetical protein
LAQQPTTHHAIRRFHDPSTPQVQRQRASVRSSQPFRPLPPPTGSFPYHLALSDVLSPEKMQQITTSGRLVFHMVGDTGGVMTPVPQMNVATQMDADSERQVNGAAPQFFYHLGDVVYFFGEAKEYFGQFYEPYEQYPAPIFAIPGNHDGDLSPDMQTAQTPSLAAFVDNFCQRIPHHTRDALDAPRSGMNQPNVYWTLDTSLARFIGLYTNVPEGGRLDDDQIAWFTQELKAVPANQAALVMMHHPVYSGDSHHSGSVYMGQVLDEVIANAGRTPDGVFCGHVHNYQRFTRTINGKQVPFIVAGAGGYHNLHKMVADFKGEAAASLPEGVVFENACDNLFGFLRLEVTATTLSGEYLVTGGFQDPHNAPAAESFETFTYNLGGA